MLLAVGQFIAGVVMLLLGGEGVVRGASRLAALARMSPLFIGLTIVSLGTSAPEMAVSVATAMEGKADITIGNVVGSNLFNMLMIVGVSAAFMALPVDRQITFFDVPVMLAATVAMFLMGIDGDIGRVDGFFLIGAVCLYFVASFRFGKRNVGAGQSDAMATVMGEHYVAPEKQPLGRFLLSLLLNALLLSLGIAGLVLGCDWFVDASVYFARVLGLSETVIGLTIVSAGTSLPELVTSVAATIKGERGIAIGNAVGSTTLNILAVLGVTGVVATEGVSVAPSVQWVDIPVMIGCAALSWIFFRTDREIGRLEGWGLMGVYGVYLAFLLARNGVFG